MVLQERELPKDLHYEGVFEDIPEGKPFFGEEVFPGTFTNDSQSFYRFCYGGVSEAFLINSVRKIVLTGFLVSLAIYFLLNSRYAAEG
jgi:hypothetical protein